MVQDIYTAVIEPRFAETDMMGVVYHANYLIWCEVARTGLSKHLGYSYSKIHEDEVIWPVRRASLDYRRPAIFGNRIYVKTMIRTFSGVRLIYNYEFSDEEGNLLATATTEHGATNSDLRVINLYKVDPEMAQCLDCYVKICKEQENK
ncbi:MAG: acyl-CoA thioesterase [Tissierellia bacterium]|nr:acyl-CoA thioesterase [Tissierellia bacterium]